MINVFLISRERVDNISGPGNALCDIGIEPYGSCEGPVNGFAEVGAHALVLEVVGDVNIVELIEGCRQPVEAGEYATKFWCCVALGVDRESGCLKVVELWHR